MAIWQFNLTAIPRKGILERYGLIPKTLDRKSVKHVDLWHSSDLDIAVIINRIDKIIKRADYGDENWVSWKTGTEEPDNDASLSLNEATKRIEDLNFRADLREKELAYLREVTSIARDYDWMLLDLKGNLVNPSKDEIIESIEKSNAYKFLSNPREFLADFADGKIEPE